MWPDEARKALEGLDDLVAAVDAFERAKLGGAKVLAKGKEGACLDPLVSALTVALTPASCTRQGS